MKVEAKATIQIQRPIEDVYEGIVDQANMTQYFIAESSGRMKTGKDLVWKFDEFPEKFPVKVLRTDSPTEILFEWDQGSEVSISLEELGASDTLVKVKEGDRSFNEENVNWALNNTEGWANFLACLKAYLQHGVRLRDGAFEFLRKN